MINRQRTASSVRMESEVLLRTKLVKYPLDMLPSRRLLHLLSYVRDRVQHDFSGIGLLIYRDLEAIPAFPLRHGFSPASRQPVAEAILELASVGNPYHDGFHLLTENLELTHSCQYLAPPIDRTVNVSPSQQIGARYMTALFASKLSSVVATGIVSAVGKVVVFENGTPISGEEL